MGTGQSNNPTPNDSVFDGMDPNDPQDQFDFNGEKVIKKIFDEAYERAMRGVI